MAIVHEGGKGIERELAASAASAVEREGPRPSPRGGEAEGRVTRASRLPSACPFCFSSWG